MFAVPCVPIVLESHVFTAVVVNIFVTVLRQFGCQHCHVYVQSVAIGHVTTGNSLCLCCALL